MFLSQREGRDTVLSGFQERIKKPDEVFRSMGPSGGVIVFYGCVLEFPRGALKEDRELSFTVDSIPAKSPPNLETISINLGLDPSVKLYKPVTVTMDTWFSAFKRQKVPVILTSKRDGSDWEKVDDIFIELDSEVTFTVPEFCHFSIGLSPEGASYGEYVLCYDIYLKKDSGMFNLVFYTDLKSKRDTSMIMSGLGYRVSAATRPSKIYGGRDETVTVEATVRSPANTELVRVHPAREFTIRDVLQQKKQEIQFEPNPPLGTFCRTIRGEFRVKVDGRIEATTLFSRRLSDTPVTNFV